MRTLLVVLVALNCCLGQTPPDRDPMWNPIEACPYVDGCQGYVPPGSLYEWALRANGISLNFVLPTEKRAVWHDYAVVDGKATELPANWADQPPPKVVVDTRWGSPCPESDLWLKFEDGHSECLKGSYVHVAKPHRSSRVLRDFQRQHPCPSGPNKGATRGPCAGFIRDHIQPLCDGGKDEVSNLQWEPTLEAYDKDRSEQAFCREHHHLTKAEWLELTRVIHKGWTGK